jgi:hypothetical protein
MIRIAITAEAFAAFAPWGSRLMRIGIAKAAFD